MLTWNLFLRKLNKNLIIEKTANFFLQLFLAAAKYKSLKCKNPKILNSNNREEESKRLKLIAFVSS